MLSIDFGTTRTKVAYYDASRGRVSLANMGGDNAAFPSLFYVGTDGQVFCGSEAMDFLDSDPGGTIRRAKSRLRDRAIRVNGRTLRPVDLVAKLFASLRKRAGEEVPAFGGKAPVSVVLTLPAAGAGSGPVVEQIMRDAASAAGFTEVWLLTEPEGAAMAWQHEEGAGHDDVVVILDGGGGTVDWACLKRVDGTLRLFADCPPGGDDKVGGEYLDEDLFGILTSKLEAREANDALMTVQSQSNKWFSRIRGLRERFNRTGKVGTQDVMRVAGEVVSLDDAEVQGAIQDRFVNQVCAGFGRYLDSVRRATGVANPRVLLVGGTGQVSGLKEALRAKCQCEPTWWQLSEFAPVIGATWWGAERAGMLVGRSGGDKAERAVAQTLAPPKTAAAPDDHPVRNLPQPPDDVPGRDASKSDLGSRAVAPEKAADTARDVIRGTPPLAQQADGTARGPQVPRTARGAAAPPVHAEVAAPPVAADPAGPPVAPGGGLAKPILGGALGCFMLLAMLIFAAIAIPNFITMQLKAKRGEVTGYVDGIKTAELAYDASFDAYVATPQAPRPAGSEGKDAVPWEGSPEWTTLNWMPDGLVRGVYWVTVAPDGVDFVVHGACDVDGDGVEVHYTATAEKNATIDPSEINVF